MFVVTFVATLTLFSAEVAPAIGRQDGAWRDAKVGEISFESISICELTSVLSEKAGFPIHLICTSMVDPEPSQFRLPKEATLGQAFDVVRNSVPKMTVRRAGSGLIWNCVSDAPFAKALDHKMDSKAVSGTLDEVMIEVFGMDYEVAGSFKVPNSPTNGDSLHIHLRSSGGVSRLDALAIAAENAEARITVLVRTSEDLTAANARPTLSCFAEGFTSQKKIKKQ